MNAGGAVAALVTVLIAGLFQSSSSNSDADDATRGPPLLRDTEAQKGGLELGTYKFFGVSSVNDLLQPLSNYFQSITCMVL
jgi:hypothetical protein